MSDLIGDGHEEKMAELAAENDFADFARPVEVAFDTAWTLAKKKAIAALEAKDREIEALRAERDALREALRQIREHAGMGKFGTAHKLCRFCERTAVLIDKLEETPNEE
jgi:hypothetical protein